MTPVNKMFEPQSGLNEDVEKFHSGKSVLFSLPRKSVTNVYSTFKINMNVIKKMPADIKPDVLVGRAQIDMTIQFAALRKEMLDLERYGNSALPVIIITF